MYSRRRFMTTALAAPLVLTARKGLAQGMFGNMGEADGFKLQLPRRESVSWTGAWAERDAPLDGVIDTPRVTFFATGAFSPGPDTVYRTFIKSTPNGVLTRKTDTNVFQMFMWSSTSSYSIVVPIPLLGEQTTIIASLDVENGRGGIVVNGQRKSTFSAAGDVFLCDRDDYAFGAPVGGGAGSDTKLNGHWIFGIWFDYYLDIDDPVELDRLWRNGLPRDIGLDGVASGLPVPAVLIMPPLGASPVLENRGTGGALTRKLPAGTSIAPGPAIAFAI